MNNLLEKHVFATTNEPEVDGLLAHAPCYFVSTMADRNHILADFQACTDINDIEQCIAILEQSDWNLMEAVQSAMSGLDSPSPSMPPPSFVDMPPSYSQAATVECSTFSGGPGNSSSAANSPLDVADITFASSSSLLLQGSRLTGLSHSSGVEAAVPIASASTSSPTASGSQPPPARMLQFNIQYRDKSDQVFMTDTETVGQLKEMIETEMAVPINKQQLRGWLNNKSDASIEDTDLLRELKLPKENNLFLLTPDHHPPATAAAALANNGDASNVLERLSQTFTLNIHYKEGDRRYNLNFPGSRTVQEVKGDVYSLIDVPVRHQVWVGWPEAATDEAMTLAGCGVGWPCHELEVSRLMTSTEPVSRAQRQGGMDVDVSDDDFEDAHDTFNDDDDDIFEVGSVRRPEPLMPENARDQTEALERFTSEFALRYGECHPVFFIGSLENALQEALLCKAKDRKLLAIYLHHDTSILANVFCSQVLCAEGVINYLGNNFITWAWDLTSEANKARLLTMCTQHFGSVAANTVRNFKPDELPLLLIISRARSINEVVNVIRANITVDELMTHLIQAVELFREQQLGEITEENEREEREQMKRDQEQAYEESLQADRAKAESRRIQEEEQQRVEMEAESKRHKEELIRHEEKQEKEALRLSIENQLPNEPPDNCTDPITWIRFRTPDGETLSRRFLAITKLQVLLNYVTSCGYHAADYKVLTTYPRRDLTQIDGTQTLDALKMCPQDTVILEAKESSE